jgi:iron-sulfur cluster repair protein YtfE (RIC family)
MAHLIRFLMQDHARINRTLDAYAASPSNLNLALAACGEVETHSAIEQDLVYPILRDEIDADEAEAAEEEHAQVQEMIDQVSDMEPGDPELPIVMKNLTNAMASHVDYEERVIFPALQKALGTRVWDIGREAFGYRQELQGQLDRPGAKPKQIVGTTGWSPSKVPNAGW